MRTDWQFQTASGQDVHVQLSEAKPGLVMLVIDGEATLLFHGDCGRLGGILVEVARYAKFAQDNGRVA